MVVALLSIECHLPAARSLKDKRMVLQSVKGRLRNLNVSLQAIAYAALGQAGPQVRRRRSG